MKKPLILVVEDNKINQKVVLSMLNKLGYDSEVAEHGREAMERLARTAYDLVLMDCQMPGMDGYDVTRAFRKIERGRRVPIVAMTAHALKGDRENCLAAGMDDYLAKPMSLGILGSKLAEWLAPHQRAAPSVPPVEETEVGGTCPSIDMNVIAELRRFEKPGNPLVAELVRLFFEETPGRLATIQQSVVNGDANAAERAAHSLKGSSGILGAKVLANLSQRLQEMGRNRNLSGAATVVKDLEIEWERVREILKTVG